MSQQYGAIDNPKDVIKIVLPLFDGVTQLDFTGASGNEKRYCRRSKFQIWMSNK